MTDAKKLAEISGWAGRAEARPPACDAEQAGNYFDEPQSVGYVREPEAAYLLYDEEQRLIGVQPTSVGNQFSFLIKSKLGMTARMINAQAFCRTFRIEPPRTVYFLEPDLDHEGILVLDLNRTGEVTTWKRKPKVPLPPING